MLIGDADGAYLLAGRADWSNSVIDFNALFDGGTQGSSNFLVPNGWRLDRDRQDSPDGPFWQQTSQGPPIDPGSTTAPTVPHLALPDYNTTTTRGGAIHLEQDVISPTIDLTNAASATLSLKYYLETEGLEGKDVAEIRIHEPGARFQNSSSQPGVLVASNQQSTGGRLADPTFRLDENGVIVLDSQDNPLRDWNQLEISLNEFVGQEIQIRFSFNAIDEFNNSPPFGWYIDDVVVETSGYVKADALAVATGEVVDVTNVSDIDADGQDDVAITMGDSVVLYFDMATTTTVVTGPSGRVQPTGNIDGDSSSGRPVNDLLIVGEDADSRRTGFLALDLAADPQSLEHARLVLQLEPDALPTDSVSQLTPTSSRLFFTARAETAGEELWISDGTLAGTRLLFDILPGPASW